MANLIIDSLKVSLVAGSNLDMAAYQLSNKSQTSNLVLLCTLV
jgi:hypothetical protein